MTTQSLKNKKIVISAGASGIGLAIVKVCLEKGATIFVSDINEKFLTNLSNILRIYKKEKNIFYSWFLKKQIYLTLYRKLGDLQ